MGRLWQTLILSEWRAELAWLPVETLIHNQQQVYYNVLGICDRASNRTPFVEFMLAKLREALEENVQTRVKPNVAMSVEMSVENPSTPGATSQQLLMLLAQQPELTVIQLAEKMGLSRRTIERHLKLLQAQQRLQRMGSKKGGRWQIV
jgi:Fic family protein